MKLEMNSRRLFRLLIALMVCASSIWTGCGAAAAADYQERAVLAALSGSDKKTAPEFELRDLNGATVKLSSFRGDKPVLLYFWATWCPYCITVKPQIAKLREKVPPTQLEILAINVGEGDSLEKVKRFQQGHPTQYPTLYDEGSKVSKTYQIQGIPLFVLVDKVGNIAYRGNSLPADPMAYLK